MKGSLESFNYLGEGVDIFNVDLHNFEYLDGEIGLTASGFLHDNENPTLVKNKEVKYYSLSPQVFTKIVFYNFLPKSGEYNPALGSASPLVYCLLRGIRVNIPKLID